MPHSNSTVRENFSPKSVDQREPLFYNGCWERLSATDERSFVLVPSEAYPPFSLSDQLTCQRTQKYPSVSISTFSGVY